MTFFNFNYITPPPNDEFVNEVTQLNDNWDKIDLRLSWLQGKPVAAPPDADRPLGLQAFVSSRQAVWNGTAWRNPTGIEVYGAWVEINYTAPYQAVAGFPVQYRINATTSYVQMRGRIQNGATGTPFGKTAWIPVGTINYSANTDPMYGASIHTVGTNAVTGGSPAGSEVAAGRVRLRRNGTNPVVVEVNYMGQDGAATNQYVAFDTVEYLNIGA